MSKLLKLSILAAVTSMLPLQHAFSAPVEQVQVRVQDLQGGTSPLLLGKMSRSMELVAQQLFLDKEEALLEADREEYRQLLQEIADRVFTGYQLQQVQLDLGPVTHITLQAAPWHTTMEQVRAEIVFSGIEEQNAQLLRQELQGLEQELEQVLQGASVDAGDWAGGVLRRLVRQRLEQALPEFRAAVDLVQSQDHTNTTLVQVVVYPTGPLVREVHYQLTSSTIPNLLLISLKYKYRELCKQLQGLPVAYVQRHREEIEQQLLSQLQQEPELVRYGLEPSVRLVPGRILETEIKIESQKYRFYIEGYGDIAKSGHNLAGRAHIGKKISPREEFFGEATLDLNDVSWRYGVGLTHNWGKSAYSWQRLLPEGRNLYQASYDFNNQWRLRAEHYSASDRNEFAIGYRIHEFLRAEYIYSDKDFYLRLLGNL